LLLGVRALISSTTTTVGDSSADSRSFALVPNLEYVFATGAVRPFLSANVGYNASTSSAGGVESSSSAFSFGPGVGLHGFANSSFSLDAGVMALLQRGTSKSAGVELDANGYSVLLTVALAGWLGNDDQVTATPLVSPASTAEPAATEAEPGELECLFVLDQPNAAGSVQVAIRPDPGKDPERVQVTLTWRKSPTEATECAAPAFENAGATTTLQDVRSSSRAGFGSTLVAQQGSLPATALTELAKASRESALLLCGERLLVLATPKRRIQRFLTEALRLRSANLR
jgi:hypothetical protein